MRSRTHASVVMPIAAGTPSRCASAIERQPPDMIWPSARVYSSASSADIRHESAGGTSSVIVPPDGHMKDGVTLLGDIEPVEHSSYLLYGAQPYQRRECFC